MRGGIRLLLVCIPLVLSSSLLAAQEQEPTDKLPFDLNKLVEEMKDDNVKGNGTGAYLTILRAREDLNDIQMARILLKFTRTFLTGDYQQVVFCAAILRRWDREDVLIEHAAVVLPKLLRGLMTEPSKTIYYAIRNLLDRTYSRISDREEAVDGSLPYKRMGRLVQETNWTVPKKRHSAVAYYVGTLLKQHSTPEKVIKKLVRLSGTRGIMAKKSRRLLHDLDPEKVVPLLEENLLDPDYHQRQFSALVLNSIRSYTPSDQCLSVMVEGLQDDDISHYPSNASSFVHRLEEAGERAVPHLADALSSGDRQQSQLAAWVLTQIPTYEPTKRYLKTVVDGLRDDNIQGNGAFANRHWSYEFLKTMGDQVVPLLQNGLESNDWQKKMYCAMLLIRKRHKPSCQKAISILLDQLKNDDVRSNAVLAERFLLNLNRSRFRGLILPELRRLLRYGDGQQCCVALAVFSNRDVPVPSIPVRAVRQIKRYITSWDVEENWVLYGVRHCRKKMDDFLEQKISSYKSVLFREIRWDDFSINRKISRLFLYLRGMEAYGRLYAMYRLIWTEARLGRQNHNYKERAKEVKRKIQPDILISNYVSKEFPEASDRQEKRIRSAIKKLGARKLHERRAAMNQLRNMGEITVPYLKNRYRDDNPEVRRRTEDLLLEMGINRSVSDLKDEYSE